MKILHPDTIVLTSPHSDIGIDYFNISYGNEISGNLSRFNAPDVKIDLEYDIGLAKKIAQQATLLTAYRLSLKKTHL